jgi:hypothetical protein
MKPFLNGKQFGLKRWQWLVLLSAGIAFGLYLRSKQAGAAVEAEEVGEELPAGFEDTIAANAEDPGLAGVAGTYGPPAGSVVPVQTPLVPEGYTETAQIGGDIAAGAVGVLGDVAVAALERGGDGEAVPAVNVMVPGQRSPGATTRKPVKRPGAKSGRGATGGGPPRPRHPKNKPRKPRQRAAVGPGRPAKPRPQKKRRR